MSRRKEEDKGTETRETLHRARHEKTGGRSSRVTEAAEQQAKKTGKLHPLVDPAGYGVVRRSLPRFVQREDGLWVMAVGMPVPKEDRLDTTGSMGDNVDIAVGVLPDSYDLCSKMLPGCDLQMATGIFADVVDEFVLCRPQFEMQAAKIVEQLTYMVPEGRGGDDPEDPQYGLFGAAYLTDTYVSKIGLKGYDFTITDAPARDRLDVRQLYRIFGDEVFERLSENGHDINRKDLPTTVEVVQDLRKRAHAFLLRVVGRHDSSEAARFWERVFGSERVIVLPQTTLLPQVESAIIGLTEGIVDLQGVVDFLRSNNVSKDDAKSIQRAVAGIPIGAQAVLPNFSKRPKKGDLFRNKTDLWPVDPADLALAQQSDNQEPVAEEGQGWL